MEKLKIDGQEYDLKSRKEVSYGAFKEVADLKEDAAVAMMPNKAIAEMWLAKGDAKEGEGVSEESLMEKLAESDLKKGLRDARKAALAPEVEAIMLSIGLTRDEVYALPKDTVDKLSQAANKALGGLVNFTQTSTTDTT